MGLSPQGATLADFPGCADFKITHLLLSGIWEWWCGRGPPEVHGYTLKEAWFVTMV